MKTLLLGLLVGLVLGNASSKYTSVYALSCDTTKYGYMWTTQANYDKDPIRCRNSNVAVIREPSLIFSLKVLKIELGL